jgi:hypothetical protein
MQIQILQRQEEEIIRIIKWLLKGINYFLVGFICRIMKNSDRSIKTVTHSLFLVGIFAVLLFPLLVFKITWLFIGLLAFNLTLIAWEQYYSRIPKKKKDDPVYMTEAQADPRSFRNRKASMEMIRSTPNVKKIQARRKGTIIKK